MDLIVLINFSKIYFDILEDGLLVLDQMKEVPENQEEVGEENSGKKEVEKNVEGMDMVGKEGEKEDDCVDTERKVEKEREEGGVEGKVMEREIEEEEETIDLISILNSLKEAKYSFI